MAHRNASGHMIALAAVVFLLAGMESGPLAAAEVDASSNGTKVNACALMSAEEISKVANFKVERGVRKDSGQISDGAFKGSYSSTCLWKASEDQDASDPKLPLGGARFAILNVMSGPAGSQVAAKFLQDFRDAAESQILTHDPVALKIGDDALWWGDGVAVRKGDISFGISVHSVNERPKEREMETVLAKKIVGRF